MNALHGTTESQKHRRTFWAERERNSVFLCFRASVWCIWVTSLVVCLQACSTAASAPGVVTIAVLSSPNNLDPRVGTDETSQRAHQLIYDNLLSLDDQLRVSAGLATHWEQPDPLTYVVHLRHGVRFHDGHEL